MAETTNGHKNLENEMKCNATLFVRGDRFNASVSRFRALALFAHWNHKKKKEEEKNMQN